MKGRVRLTGLGAVALAVFAGFVILALAGSGGAQVAGFVGALLVAIGLVGGVPMRGGGASAGYKLTSTERGKTIRHVEPEVLDEAPTDPAAWRRERERREGTAAEPASGPAYNPFEGGGQG